MSDSEFTPEELQNEEWRDAIGYEHLFRVSTLGRAFGKRSNRLIRGASLGKGYRRLSVKRGEHVFVHSLILATFIGPCPNSYEPDHADGDPSNNRLSNLEYVTRSENVSRAYKLGLTPSGEKHHWHTNLVRACGERNSHARLTISDVIAIRKDTRPHLTIAQEYGVRPSAISKIKTRRTWRHLP